MTLTTTIQSYLSQAPTSEFRGLDVAIVDHWEGRDNLLWRIEARRAAADGHAAAQTAVLKLFLDAGQARSRRQYDGQTIFAPLGIAPQPLWYDRYPEGLSRQIMVYRWAPGEAPAPTDEQHLHELARAVSMVHGGDAGEVRRVSPNPINLDYLWRLLAGSTQKNVAWLGRLGQTAMADAFTGLGDAAAALVANALPLWHGVPPAPVHGDLRLENAVIGPGGCVLLDWEMFGLGDPAQEAAHFLELSKHEMTATQQATWLDLYLATMDQPGLDARVAVYRHVAAYRAVSFLLDGLRELAADPQALAAHGDDLPFLAATFTAATQEAAAVFATAAPTPAQIDTFFTALQSNQGVSHE